MVWTMSTQTRKFKVGDLYVGNGRDLPVRTVLVDIDGDATQKRMDGSWNRSYADDNAVLSYAIGSEMRIVFLPETKAPKVGAIISTASEFEALPPKSVVMDRAGDSFQKQAPGEFWMQPGSRSRYTNEEMPTTTDAPFQVLHVGQSE